MKSVKIILEGEEQKYIDSRVQDVEKAAARSRWIYAVVSLLSLMMFSVAYNEYFAWTRGMSLSLDPDGDKVGFDRNSWPDQLSLLLLREWVSGLQFDLPYIGGKFGASDAGIIGGIILLLASIWCYYSARRENHLVYFLVKDIKEFTFSENARFYLCNQLISTQLFVHGKSKAYGKNDIEKNDTAKSSENLAGDKQISLKIMDSALSTAMLLVFMLPAFSLLFTFVVDMLTLGEVSPFRNHQEKQVLYMIVCKNENHFDFIFWDIYNLAECENSGFLLRLCIAFSLMITVSKIMLLARKFQIRTEELVRYTEGWKAPVLKRIKAAEPEESRTS